MASPAMRIQLTSYHDLRSTLRQTPSGDGKWQDAKFEFSQEDQPGADWLIVFDEPPSEFVSDLPKERRVLVVGEPPGFKIYHSRFLSQFGAVISPLPRPTGYRGLYHRQQSGLPWFYGLDMHADPNCANNLSWQALSSGPGQLKANKVSVICSTKRKLRQHRERLRFVNVLQDRLGDRVDVFGTGFRAIADKADAIGPYKYHVVLENNSIDHFWTEKTADCLLGETFMFFSGCRNIGDYFASEVFRPIDVSRPERAVDTIEAALEDNLYDRAVPKLVEARTKVMNDHNMYNIYYELCHSLHRYADSPSGQHRRERLRTLQDFPISHRYCQLGRRAMLLSGIW